METESDRSRLEAVVIATGPTMIRLVTRTGRRITFPTGRWEIAWTRVQEQPAEPQRCRNCRQVAYFRHTVGGETVWVCEDHLPNGAHAYFPGDTPGPPTVEVTCPRCESTRVTVDPELVPLSNERTTARLTCDACHCCWSTLVGRGLGDDGATLAGDLARMIENDPSISEAWLGFVAYRSLCRAIGMGDMAHIHGVPLQSKSSLADTLTFVFSNTAAEQTRNPVIAERLPPFGLQFPASDIAIGSQWKRRTVVPQREQFCTVVSSGNEHHVICRVSEGPAITVPIDRFRLNWTPNVLLTERPREWTIWRHVETQQLVQVVPGTPTQSSNNQVSYFTPEGRRESTPIVTFYRLYHELPTPPEHHIWHKDGELFIVERREETLLVHPYTMHDESREADAREVSAATLYGLYNALVFADELVVHHPNNAVLQKDDRWYLKADPQLPAFIVDVGRAGSADFVRFTDRDGLRVLELTQFLAEFERFVLEARCQVGETWVGLDQPSRQGTVVKVDVFGRATLRWETGFDSTLSRDELTSQFRKLDVRSYWEILDSEEES